MIRTIKKYIALLLLDISLFLTRLSMRLYPTQTMSIDLETATKLFLNAKPTEGQYMRTVKE